MTIDPSSGPNADEWRKRFILLNMVRIGGTAIVLVGLLIWHTDVLRQGGWLSLGLGIALLGLLVSFGGSQALVRRWRTPPGS
jgi:hypothetical protein